VLGNVALARPKFAERCSNPSQGTGLMNRHDKLENARQQVVAMTGFYIHLTVFVIVTALLFVINATGSAGWWAHWPFLGWGIFVILHGLMVFARVPDMIRRWQLRKIRELSEKM